MNGHLCTLFHCLTSLCANHLCIAFCIWVYFHCITCFYHTSKWVNYQTAFYFIFIFNVTNIVYEFLFFHTKLPKYFYIFVSPLYFKLWIYQVSASNALFRNHHGTILSFQNSFMETANIISHCFVWSAENMIIQLTLISVCENNECTIDWNVTSCYIKDKLLPWRRHHSTHETQFLVYR